nr:hypothetical protein [Clostridioides sp.]
MKFSKTLLGGYTVDGIEFTTDYWIGVYEQKVDLMDSNFNKDCIFYIKKMKKILSYNEFINYCNENNIRTFRYTNKKTKKDELIYKDLEFYNINRHEKKVVLSDNDTFTPIIKKNNILNSLERYILSKDDKLRGESIE